MRHISAWLLALVWLVPALAPLPLHADNTVGRSECRHLSTQIDFYEGRLERAEALGNELWQTRIEGHLESLEKRLEKRCPGYGDDDDEETLRLLAELLRLAGKGALTFFTMGAF